MISASAKSLRIFLATAALAACGDDGQASNDPAAGDPAASDPAASDGTAATGDSEGAAGESDLLLSQPESVVVADFSIAGTSPDGTPHNVAGRHDHLVMVDGEARSFIVYVPELVAGPVEAPVVLMFHGTSGDGERFYNISGWREQADQEGLIAVFPTALTYCYYEDENHDGDIDDRGERHITTKWAAGKLGDELPLCSAEEIAALPDGPRARADHPLRDDLVFVDAMLDTLEAEYTIDVARVYASGFSNGAGFTSLLAAERSDRFAAVAAAAGTLDDDLQAPSERPISVVFSLGALDDGFTTGFGVDAVPLDESALDLPAFRGIVNRYLALLELEDVYTHEQVEVNGQTVSRFIYSTSTTGADNELQVAVIEGLHHQYPNGRNHPIMIVDPLWTFFSRYSLSLD